MFINSKEDLINYFYKGIKKELFIGVENEKFLFDGTTNSRAAYPKVKEVLNYLKNFGWQEITEEEMGEDLFFGIARVKKLNANALLAIAPILLGSFKLRQTIIFVPLTKENSDSEI